MLDTALFSYNRPYASISQLTDGAVLDFKAGDSVDNITTTDINSYTNSKYARVELGYPISVGGELVTPYNKNDIFPNGINAGKAKYNSDTKTLSLDNVVLEKNIAGKGIIDISLDGVTLEINGTNTITNTNNNTANSDAISSTSQFTIIGEGVLNAKSGTVSSYAVNGNAIITGGKQSFVGSSAAFSQTPTITPYYSPMPQISGNTNFSGSSIGISFARFNAEKSTLPSDTKLVLTPLDEETTKRLQSQMNGAIDTSMPTLFVDIKLLSNDIEVEPTPGTIIHFDMPQIKAGDNIVFVHEITGTDGTKSYEKTNITAIDNGFSISPTSLSPFSFYRMIPEQTPAPNPALSPLTGVYN